MVLAKSTRIIAMTAVSDSVYTPSLSAWTAIGSSAARAIPAGSMGLAPVSRAILKNSHAPRAARTDRTIARIQSPKYTMATLAGAAMTAKMMRRVSSDTSKLP